MRTPPLFFLDVGFVEPMAHLSALVVACYLLVVWYTSFKVRCQQSSLSFTSPIVKALCIQTKQSVQSNKDKKNTTQNSFIRHCKTLITKESKESKRGDYDDEQGCWGH